MSSNYETEQTYENEEPRTLEMLFEQRSQTSRTNLKSDNIEIAYVSEGYPLRYCLQEGSPILEEGNICKVLESLTDPGLIDFEYIQRFLFIYCNFLTPRELLGRLVKRFSHRSPDRKVELEYRKLKLSSIQKGVLCFLHVWVGEQIQDFIETEELQNDLTTFLTTTLKEINEKESELFLNKFNNNLKTPLKKIYYQRADNSYQNTSTPTTGSLNSQPNSVSIGDENGLGGSTHEIDSNNYRVPNSAPETILPPNLNKLKLEEISPIELARQITLIDRYLIIRIKFCEFVNLPWCNYAINSDQFEKQAHNLNKFFKRFESLRLYVSNTIINLGKNPTKRANYIEIWIDVAIELLNLNNFNSLFSIISGLQSHSIMRLDLTWREVKISSKRLLDKLLNMTSPENNYRKYRNTLKNSILPVIPFLDLYLYDISLINHLYPNYINNNSNNNNNNNNNNYNNNNNNEHNQNYQKIETNEEKIINLKKFMLIADIFKQIQTFQRCPYFLKMIPEITDFLINIKNLNEDKLLKKSQSKIEKNTKYTYFNLLFGCLSEQEIDQIKAQFEKQNNINSSRNNLTENVNENNQEQEKEKEKEKEKEINNKKQKEDEEKNKILLYQNYCSICSCWNYKLRESIEKSNLFLTDKIEEQEKFIKEFQNLNLEDCLLEEGDSSNDKQGNNMTKKKNPKSSSSLTGNDLESKSKTIVIAATVEWLVDYLCSESGSDSEYIQIFLLTYRSFTTATELLTLLKKKYLEKPPGSLSGKRLELYKEKISKQIKFRIFNILNQWIRFHFYDFESDPSLIEHIENFIAKVMLPDNIMSKPGKMLKAILSKMQKAEKNPILHLQLQSTQEMPKPILPKELGEISFAALDRIEFARQITLIEFDLYRKIQPKECLKQGWTKKDKDVRTPNIVKLTNYFNNMSNWFANEIVSHSKLRTRIQILTKIIKLAIQARKIGNYNIIQEIIAGCNNASVYRLKKTWAGITTKIKNKYDQLVKLMERDNNYRLIRKELSTIDPPALPYIGMYLTDLVFVGEGNPDFLTSLDGRKKLINFDKRRRTSFVIREIQLYQQAPFLFQEVPKIKDFILKISNADYDEEKMYDQSLIVEPRERK